MPRIYTRRSIADRLHDKTNKNGSNGCWIFTGVLSGKGYGYISIGGAGGRMLRAHRVAYELKHGPVPDGLLVLHKCRCRACVNPDHLELGTHKKNNGPDMIRDGTLSCGERNGRSILTSMKVYWIRRLYATGMCTQQALADIYGVSRSTVEDIVLRKKWKHLKDSDVESTLPLHLRKAVK
jgi:hypothetical protein